MNEVNIELNMESSVEKNIASKTLACPDCFAKFQETGKLIAEKEGNEKAFAIDPNSVAWSY